MFSAYIGCLLALITVGVTPFVLEKVSFYMEKMNILINLKIIDNSDYTYRVKKRLKEKLTITQLEEINSVLKSQIKLKEEK